MFWNKKPKINPAIANLALLVARLDEKLQSVIDVIDEPVEPVEPVEQDDMVAGSPFVSLVGSDIDNQGKIKIELNWNDEFVDSLRANGFQGNTEEIIIQKWLVKLSDDINSNLVDNGSTYE